MTEDKHLAVFGGKFHNIVCQFEKIREIVHGVNQIVDVSHQMVKVLYYNFIEEVEVRGSGMLVKLYKPEVNRRLASDSVLECNN